MPFSACQFLQFLSAVVHTKLSINCDIDLKKMKSSVELLQKQEIPNKTSNPTVINISEYAEVKKNLSADAD